MSSFVEAGNVQTYTMSSKLNICVIWNALIQGWLKYSSSNILQWNWIGDFCDKLNRSHCQFKVELMHFTNWNCSNNLTDWNFQTFSYNGINQTRSGQYSLRSLRINTTTHVHNEFPTGHYKSRVVHKEF